MSDVKPETTTEVTPVIVPVIKQQGKYEARNTRNSSRNGRDRGDRRSDRKEEKDPYDFKIVEVRRVSKMFKGGRRMKLSVAVVVGDKKGQVGIGIGKGDDVRSAQEKAITQAKKNLVLIPLKGNTIPHEVNFKFKASRIFLKPAAPGTGIVAGSSVRMVAEVAGINDVLSKILGGNNKITNAYATVKALASLRSTRL